MDFQEFFEAFMHHLDKGIEFHPGQVYYDSRTNRFLQLRKRHDDFYLCCDFSKSYRDTLTIKAEQKLSPKYLEGCIEVECLDEHPELWEHDGFGWIVKGKK